MNEIWFSSWDNQVSDNRGPAKGAATTIAAPVLPESFRRDESIRAFMGWSGILLRSDAVNMVDLCRAHMQAVNAHSCGKCIPCRTGTQAMAETLQRICEGHGRPEDIEALRSLAKTVCATAKCGIGQTGPKPLLDALDHFGSQFEQAVAAGEAIPDGETRSRVTAPCTDACPIHLDIPAYIEAIREGRYEDALSTIRQRLPIPGVVGRVCVRPCEEHCRRMLVDDPVSIKYLKRFVADHERAMNRQPEYPVAPGEKTGKVAIVGAGPAGVTCAYHLASRGHQVTIYESLAEPGGMAAMGIPDYRLPRAVLRREVEQIQAMGVTVHYNTQIGKEIRLSELEADNDAVFIAVGAQGSMSMRVEGEDNGYQGFISGVQYLRDINEGRDPYPEGSKVVVIGGGNVAIDCVRCSFRVNKKDVHLVYRRTRKEMPADEVEIVDAEEEKVQFNFLTTPVRIIEEGGKVTGLECIRMELGTPDKSGRRRPVPVEGSEFVFDCDTVVPAIGQSVDLSLLEDADDVKRTRWNTLEVDPVTKQTTRPKLFSAGDCETGPGALITACAGGRQAARSIDCLISGEPIAPDEEEDFNHLFASVGVFDPDEKVGLPAGFKRKHLEMLPPETRKFIFDEVEQGFSYPDAIAEASRCLRCYRVATIAV